MDVGDDLTVVTERLGVPKPLPLWRRLLFWPREEQLVHDDRSEEPTALCHYQRDPDDDALCGHPRQLLITIPGEPAWTDLPADLRCPDCAEEASAHR